MKKVNSVSNRVSILSLTILGLAAAVIASGCGKRLDEILDKSKSNALAQCGTSCSEAYKKGVLQAKRYVKAEVASISASRTTESVVIEGFELQNLEATLNDINKGCDGNLDCTDGTQAFIEQLVISCGSSMESVQNGKIAFCQLSQTARSRGPDSTRALP